MLLDIAVILRVTEKALDLALKIHEDIPAEERRKYHERWGRFWDALWKQIEKAEKADADVTP